MARALTVRAINALRPEPKRIEVPDALAPGLFLIVQPSGAKSWAFRYRSPIDGRPRKLTIGPYPAFGLADAREEASTALRSAKRGIDPSEARKQAKAKAADKSDLVDNLLDDFVKRHVEAKNRPSTATEAKRLIDQILRPAWGKRKIQTIGRRDVVSLLDETVDRGAAITANRLLALVRKFMNWLVERSMLEISPAMGVKAPTEEISRDRVLTDDEIRWLWKATEPVGAFNAAVRLLLLTGQRRSEVAGLTDRELDLKSDAPVWSIPPSRTKNGRLQVVPLTQAALNVIASVPRIEKSQLILTTNGVAAISGWSKAKAALDVRMLEAARLEAEELGIDVGGVSIGAWRLHDLRRTAASGMARLGVPIHVVEAVLNHRSGSVSGVAAIYNRYDYLEEKRRALRQWSELIERLTSPDQANVVPMRAR